jgi:C-terminal processing protease CtpA/Prc
MSATAVNNSANLKSDTPLSDSDPAFQLVARKLAAGAELTADDYRSLGIGYLGYGLYRTFFQPVAKVESVDPGSPAQLAGIRKGDTIIVQHVDDSYAKDSPTTPRWMIQLRRAGVPVDVTVERHRKELTFHMVSINVEDIPDATVRSFWEETIRNLGNPGEGEYFIPQP